MPERTLGPIMTQYVESKMQADSHQIRVLKKRIADLEHVNQQLREKLERAGLWDNP